MKIFRNDFLRSFVFGFAAASLVWLATMHHDSATAVSQSLLPSAQAADASSR